MAVETVAASATLRTFALAAATAAETAGDPGWQEGLVSCLRHPASEDAPLLDLARQLGLSRIEILSVALAAAVEDDLRTGRAVAHLQAPIAGSRPTLGLLATCLAPLAQPGEHPLEVLANGPAVRCGLLTVAAEGGPLPERAVAVPTHLVFALRGRDAAVPGTCLGLGEVPEVPLAPSILAEARRHASALAAAPRRALLLRSGSNAEGRSVAAAIAAALGLRPLFVDVERPPAGFSPWLLLRGLLPVFCFEPGPGERKTLPPLPAWSGPILALCGPDGAVETAAGLVPDWPLPVPPRIEREALWSAALGDPDLAANLARDHRHGSGRIALLGRLAAHRAALRDRERPEREDVVAAAWSGEGAGLDTLAQPLRDPIPDHALVIPAGLRKELDLLLLRCRSRDGLADGLGASASTRYLPGMRALFVGASGTGKTLAAGWLATRLGLPLYRVDLASVTSKYIGETEKNLAQLLARAEQSEVVLLFDEADSLFGKRTDVRDSNDRFANAQTNYLLQRIESFDGIALLTSNSRSRFDGAFSRRLDAILDFPLPGPEERRELWQAHLGRGHRLSPREINQLAATADLAGGHIRNAVLTAAVLARDAGRPLEAADVAQGVCAEYRKLGRQMPHELKGLV